MELWFEAIQGLPAHLLQSSDYTLSFPGRFAAYPGYSRHLQQSKYVQPLLTFSFRTCFAECYLFSSLKRRSWMLKVQHRCSADRARYTSHLLLDTRPKESDSLCRAAN